MKQANYFKNIDKASTVNIALTVVFILFSFWILAIKNASMLRWYDEMSLFESNWFYFRQFIYYPGGLLRYAGTYLTQLLYYPVLGTCVLILLWLLCIALTRTTFGFKKALYPFTFLVPLCLLVSVVQLDEAWLSLKSTGYVYFTTLGYLFTITAFWIYRKAGSRIPVTVTVALVIPFFYTLAGFYALLAGVLCIIDSIAKGRKSLMYYAIAALTLIFVIAIPKIYYIYLPGNTVDNDYLYLKGLPELLMEPYDTYLWRPFIAASSIILIFGLLQAFGMMRLKESAAVRWIGVAMVAGGGIWASVAEHKSEHLRATVLMLRCLENNDWKGILHILSLTRETPNYSMLVLANIAQDNLGGEPQDLSQFQPYNIDARHSEAFTMTAFIQVPANYYIGHFNQSYRWAMEHNVQYGKRVFFLKYMVKDALMRGEIKLAKRYNDILMSTMFHRKWAKEMNRYIENPELIDSNPEFITVRLLNKEEKERR
ncbi:MAG: hypothetical protein K2J63_09615 [Muribaculaceae bacterium]|nr:hypothetical protein [Muribaculaceae bacterium]